MRLLRFLFICLRLPFMCKHKWAPHGRGEDSMGTDFWSWTCDVCGIMTFTDENERPPAPFVRMILISIILYSLLIALAVLAFCMVHGIEL